MKFLKLICAGLLTASMIEVHATKTPNFEHYLAWEYGASVNPKTLKENMKLRITFQSIGGKNYLLISMNEALRNKMPKNLRDSLEYYGNFYHYASAPEVLNWQGFNKDSQKTDRLGIVDSQPQIITAKDCANLINGSGVLFYTGYGISSAANATDTAEIENSLDLKNTTKQDKAHHVVEVATKLLSSPEKYLGMYQKVLKKLKPLEPTDAHRAIAKMTKEPVLTENSDKLHQMTNVQVLTPRDFKDKARMESMLRNTQYIITVGLIYDENGILKTFKDVNKSGKIIAFSDRKPYYLSSEDYLVLGDIQETIPELKAHLK